MTGRIQLRRALLSICDKKDLGELATALHAAGVKLVSTGSIATRIAAAGIPMTSVGQLAGFPECLDGRVKALHPHIHAGVLTNRRLPAHVSQLKGLGVAPSNLVVVNLYPFKATAASGTGTDECVEQIDIGGPSMVCAAAKNRPSIAMVTSASQYPAVLAALTEGEFALQQRRDLATEAFRHIVSYNVAVAPWIGTTVATPAGDGFPAWLGAAWVKKQGLHYGENSHQVATLYAYPPGPEGTARAELLHGKPMNYNNYTDDEAAYHTASDFTEPHVAIIKHTNPCEIAAGSDIAEAHRRAHACDPVSAFGGVIVANHPVAIKLAEQIKDIFTKVMIAPGLDPEALAILTTEKNLRLLKTVPYTHRKHVLRPIPGGTLPQRPDRVDVPGDDPANWKLKTGEAADDATLADLVFAWWTCHVIKSNAILLARDGASVGVGMGQVNRVDLCRLAVERAGERAAGSVATSDAFFPFTDGPRILVDGGVRAIVQPSGSLRDQETIGLCAEHGVTPYFTGTHYFSH